MCEGLPNVKTQNLVILKWHLKLIYLFCFQNCCFFPYLYYKILFLIMFTKALITGEWLLLWGLFNSFEVDVLFKQFDILLRMTCSKKRLENIRKLLHPATDLIGSRALPTIYLAERFVIVFTVNIVISSPKCL